MVNGQVDMDPLRTTTAIPPNPPFLHDLLRMARATPMTVILHELPLALVTQKTAIVHEDMAQPIAILHELPLALATRRVIHQELLNMALVTPEDLPSMAPVAAQAVTLPDLQSMALAAVVTDPHHHHHSAGSEVDRCFSPTFEFNGLLINLSVLCILHIEIWAYAKEYIYHCLGSNSLETTRFHMTISL
jgi:hypothetical protein